MRHFTADVVVVGGGPAGIAAAVTAAEGGAQVLLLDDNPLLGGQIWRNQMTSDPQARHWARRLEATKAEIRTQTRVLAGAGKSTLLAESGRESFFVEFGQLVLATGARELFLPFPGWTLPGVAGAGGLQALFQGGMPIENKRVVVAGSGPLLFAVAAHLRQRGANVRAVVEQAPLSSTARFGIRLPARKLIQAAHFVWELRGLPILYSSWLLEAHGDHCLRTVRVQTPNGVRNFDCDYLACGFGLIPNTELAQLLGCELREGFVAVDETQRSSVAGVFCAGEPTFIGGLDSSLIAGQIAGYAATGRTADRLIASRKRSRMFAVHLERAFVLRRELKHLCTPETIVCRCEDITWGQIAGRTDWKSAKLQTRCGMGPCQGRICGPAFSFLTQGSVKPDSVRPPLFPVSMETLASSPDPQLTCEQ